MKRILYCFTILALALSPTACEKISVLFKPTKVNQAAPQQEQVNPPSSAVLPEQAKAEPSQEAPIQVQEGEKAGTPSDTGVLARLNGVAITDEEVTERVQNRLKKLESQIFDIKSSGLKTLIEERLIEAEAKSKGTSADELIKAEVDGKVEQPSEQDIETFYNLFKQRFGNEPLEQVKGRVISQLRSTRQGNLYAKFIGNLKAKANIEILMDRPRMEVSVDDDPFQGTQGAPITLVEFSDFQCPFCKRARPTITQILDAYKDKVLYVYRDFPLSFHKQAQKAAEAANCAGDQGKYWEYNSKLWDNQTELEPDKLRAYASQLSLDGAKFNQCLDSDKFANEITEDLKQGAEAGVSGTPAYFINGIFISGAQPFENFQEIIEEELLRLGKKS